MTDRFKNIRQNAEQNKEYRVTTLVERARKLGMPQDKLQQLMKYEEEQGKRPGSAINAVHELGRQVKRLGRILTRRKA